MKAFCWAWPIPPSAATAPSIPSRGTAPRFRGAEHHPEELGFAITLGEVEFTECDMVSRYTGRALDPCFTRGYGLVFGNNERKALSMSIVDRALRARELQEDQIGPAQNPEFVLMHGDNVDASGFVQHIKLPHYVDFQAELSLIASCGNASTRKKQAAAASEKTCGGHPCLRT